MNKEEIIKKLETLGITTTNCYSKKSFIINADVHIALYKSEMLSDFYFYNSYNKKIYLFKKVEDYEVYKKDPSNTDKFLIPLHECQVIWEDKEYVELPDNHYNTMTLRQYACIHLKIPESGLDWLDILIQKAL